MRKEPTLASHCESTSGPTVLIQVHSLGVSKGNILVINRRAGHSTKDLQSLVKSYCFVEKLVELCQPEQTRHVVTPRRPAMLVDVNSGA